MAHLFRITLFALCLAGGARAQMVGPTEQGLAEVSRFGAVATLAPLCGLRDDAWAGDLRQAMIQSSTGADAHDEAGLRAAPGQELAVTALGFADIEATESFAEESPDKTCDALKANPDLGRADERVRTWRLRKQGKPVGDLLVPRTGLAGASTLPASGARWPGSVGRFG